MKPYNLILLIIIVSCSTDSNEKIISTHSNGEVKEKVIIVDEKRQVNLIYDENGNILDSLNYFNEKLNGVCYSKSSDGEYGNYISFVDNVTNGIDSSVFRNGTLRHMGFNENGVKVGEWYFYYPNGEIKEYSYMDKLGRKVYSEEFNNKGTMVSQFGHGVVKIDVDGVDSDSKAIKMLKIRIERLQPYQSELIIKYDVYNEDDILFYSIDSVAFNSNSDSILVEVPEGLVRVENYIKVRTGDSKLDTAYQFTKSVFIEELAE